MERRNQYRSIFPSSSRLLRECELDVLAALSWLWDAQERAGVNRLILPGDAVTITGAGGLDGLYVAREAARGVT
jgi:hypothetical protein